MGTSSVLFATMNFLARLASAHLSWTLVVSVRALIGAAVALAIASVRGARMTVRYKRGIWWRSAWGTLAMLCTFYAVSDAALPLGDAVTLLNLTPIFLAAIAPFVLRERAGRRVWIALPISLLGAVLVLRPAFLFGGAALSLASLKVASVCITGAISTSFAMIMLRQIGPYESAESIAIHFSLTAAAVTGVLALPHVASARGSVTPRDLVWTLAAGLCGGLAQLCMTRAYSLERAARVSGLGYLTVVVSAALGAIALHEWPTPMTLAGMALVITGGLVVTLAGLRRA